MQRKPKNRGWFLMKKVSWPNLTSRNLTIQQLFGKGGRGGGILQI